ncbi:MAG: hypothetical protein ACPG7F_01755 [Aggregatilineales bacterium]
MDILVMRQETATDGRISVVYIILNNDTAKCAEVMLPAGTDVAAYGTTNASTLYNSADAKDSTAGTFNSVKETQYRAIHLAAIFAAFEQLSLNGGVPEMVLAAKTAYQADSTKLAEVLAFEIAYKAATDDQRKSLQACAIYAIAALIGSQ